MPNWCSNCISFEGNEKAMETLRNDVAIIKDGHSIFTALTDYKEEWDYNAWCNEFGTKWSVDMDDEIRDTFEEFDYFNCETAWSPCVAFVQKVCKKYGVCGRIEYSEPGNDFAGFVSIDVDGCIVDEEEMSCKEYEYKHVDVDYFFSNFVDDVRDGWYESEKDVRDMYSFVTDEDMLKLIELFNYNFPSKN